jgi:RNA polymerase sigma-70 factor (ECF subfamily)
MEHSDIEQSFLKLYDQFADSMFRYCYFRVSSRQTAEDLTQETFMRIWNYLATGKTIENPKAFLYRIAGNLIIDYYRKKKDASLDALSDFGFDPSGDGEDSILEYAESMRMRDTVQKVESPYRQVLIMRYIDNFSITEIAEELQESENTISVRIHRGVQKLKKLLHHGNTN